MWSETRTNAHNSLRRGPTFGHTDGWVEFIDIIPGVTDLEKLMQEPFGDEPPEDRATSSSAND